MRHLQDKLLRIQNDLATPTGRKFGAERSAFIESFLHHFFQEWRAGTR